MSFIVREWRCRCSSASSWLWTIAETIVRRAPARRRRHAVHEACRDAGARRPRSGVTSRARRVDPRLGRRARRRGALVGLEPAPRRALVATCSRLCGRHAQCDDALRGAGRLRAPTLAAAWRCVARPPDARDSARAPADHLQARVDGALRRLGHRSGDPPRRGSSVPIAIRRPARGVGARGTLSQRHGDPRRSCRAHRCGGRPFREHRVVGASGAQPPDCRRAGSRSWSRSTRWCRQ